MMATFLIFMWSLINMDKTYERADFQWKNRLVLIGGSNESLIRNQVEAFRKSPDQLEDRKLMVFFWDFEKEGFIEIKKGFRLTDNNFKEGFNLKLYGLDGGEKRHAKDVIPPQMIYDLIDSMPMRVRELRNRKE